MKKQYLIIAALAVAFTACEQGEKEVTLDNERDSVSYALGLNVAEGFKRSNLDSIEVDAFAQGLKEQLGGEETKVSVDEANGIIQAYLEKERVKQFESVKSAGEAFLAANKSKEGVVELPSGLQYKVIKEGSGAKPTLDDAVTAHYHGTLADGTVFDSSVERGQPATFPLNGVIRGWQEGLQYMSVGSKHILYVPYQLAYGEQGSGNGSIGPYEMLIFEVELLGIEKDGAKKMMGR